MWFNFHSSSQSLGNYSTRSSHHCPHPTPKPCHSPHRHCNCFSEHPPRRKMQREKELQGTDWVEESIHFNGTPFWWLRKALFSPGGKGVSSCWSAPGVSLPSSGLHSETLAFSKPSLLHVSVSLFLRASLQLTRCPSCHPRLHPLQAPDSDTFDFPFPVQRAPQKQSHLWMNKWTACKCSLIIGHIKIWHGLRNTFFMFWDLLAPSHLLSVWELRLSSRISDTSRQGLMGMS